MVLIIFPFVSRGWGSSNFDEPPKLWVLVPGINTWGGSMIDNAKQMLRYDPECTIIIQEAEGWNTLEIGNFVVEATKKAIQKGKDVIILVDMDLDHNLITSHLTPESLSKLPVIGTKWFNAVDWAGQTINLVSTSYSEAGGKGQRVVDCHSAGCDGFESSLRFALVSKGGKARLFDQVFLSNGRISGSEIGPLLQKCGYSWSQVNLLLNKGDLPAHPHSLSNLDEAKRHAGQWWTVFYAKEMSGRHMDHSVLIDKLRVPGSFEVFAGNNSYSFTATVEELKLGKVKTEQGDIRSQHKAEYKKDDKYPFKPPDPPDKFGGAGIPSLGGVIFDKNNSYTIDHTGRVTRFKNSALQARPNKGSTSWEFNQEGKSYKAVTIPLAKKKQESIQRGDLYYDDKEKIVVLIQDDDIIAFKFVRRGSYLHIVQIAEGERVKGQPVSHKTTIFVVKRVVLTDYVK